MSLNAEDLLDRQLVFALAQKPHSLDGDVKIASLFPLMDLENGSSLQSDPATFPSHGYVRWYRVPPGEWLDGDLVIGTLKRNEHNGHGLPEKEWYQVFANFGESANGRVFELVGIPLPLSELRSLLQRRVAIARPPSNEFYVLCEDAVVGPFKANVVSRERKCSLKIIPSSTADGEVDVFDRAEFEQSNISIVQTTTTLSSSEFAPAFSSSGIYRTKYRIFTKQDLENSGLKKVMQYLLSNELLVTKASKQIRIGKKWTALRDELKPLVSLLDENPAGISLAVVDGLPKLLREAELRVEWTEQLSNAVIESERFSKLIADRVDSRVEVEVRAKANYIEAEAKKLASTKIDSIEQQIEALNDEREKLNAELSDLEEAKLVSEMRAEELMTGVRNRLESGRNELLGEMALLAPFFQSGQGFATGNNGHLGNGSEIESVEATQRPSQPISKSLEAAKPESPAIDERAFVDTRLWPCLLNQGCGLSKRDTEFFHAMVVAGRLIGVPHPGWVVGYAEAMGGTAWAHTISASPDWLSFDSAFSGPLANAWQKATRDPTRLHLIVIDGIDRCPSHAWLRPWLNILAGWSSTLPDAGESTWPENVRVCVTLERSEACFDVPSELMEWILDFQAGSVDVAAPLVAVGHFPLDAWIQNSDDVNDETFDGFVKNLEIPAAKPFSRMRTHLACRLRDALLRLNEDDAARCESIITKRLFRCWTPEGAE